VHISCQTQTPFLACRMRLTTR